jgi:subtilisin family serine protease
VAGNNNTSDDNGHGTHTAGTIAATGNNGVGVTGVAWKAKVMPLKFLNASGIGDLTKGAQALQYAADMGAKVSSNSYGCSCQSSLTDDAVRYEHDRSMATVVAAGNSYGDALDSSPAASDGAITVGASAPDNR